MTTFFLVRHAEHALVNDVLVGRTPSIHLAPGGREQAKRLARRFLLSNITSVQSSPRERALETALPISQATGVPLDITPSLDEVDFGEWNGLSFKRLKSDPRWQFWNRRRSQAQAPGGESMLDVQSRVVDHLHRLSVRQPHQRIVLVTHAEIIRAALLYHLGLPLEAYDRIEISPASVTVLRLGVDQADILALNEAAAA